MKTVTLKRYEIRNTDSVLLTVIEAASLSQAKIKAERRYGRKRIGTVIAARGHIRRPRRTFSTGNGNLSGENSMARKSTLGQRIKLRREKLDQGVATLAEKIGIHRVYLYEIEADEKTPSLDMLGRIADALGCTIGDLTDG